MTSRLHALTGNGTQPESGVPESGGKGTTSVALVEGGPLLERTENQGHR